MSGDTETSDHATETVSGGESGVREWASVYLKGAAMGAADTVPGVSGGTIALITGVYERFVRALTNLDPAVLRRLPRLTQSSERRALFEDLRRMDLFFLVVLGLGVATSIVTLSRVVHAALVEIPAHTFAFFFGLIAASAVVLYGELTVDSTRQIIAGLVGFAVAFLISGAAAGDSFGSSLPVIFVAGMVAITAMVLPGISGSFILILLGQYRYLTGVLKDFVDTGLGVLTGGSLDGILDLTVVVGTFGVGAVIGLLSIAHVIRWALEHYREATLVFLVSLMVGSLRLPVLEIDAGVADWTPVAAGTILGAIAVGGGAVLALDYYTQDLSEMT